MTSTQSEFVIDDDGIQPWWEMKRRKDIMSHKQKRKIEWKYLIFGFFFA